MDWRVQLQIKDKLLCCPGRFLTGSFWLTPAWKSLCWKPRSLKQYISALLWPCALHLGLCSASGYVPQGFLKHTERPRDSLLLPGENLLVTKACVSLPLLGTYLSAFLSANQVRRADIKEYEILDESFEICAGWSCVEKGLRPLVRRLLRSLVWRRPPFSGAPPWRLGCGGWTHPL